MKNGTDLRNIMQKAQEGYAYEVMALQIEIQSSTGNEFKVESLSRLLQLYMMAVELLESKSDQRYKYFNAKIQNLVKKRIVLEEMHKTTKKAMEPQVLCEAKKIELGEKKQDYNLQMYLNKDLITSRKIREFVDTAQNRIQRIESRVQSNMQSQDKDLEERIKRRRMRSEAGSVGKFKHLKGQTVEGNIAGEKLNQFFQPFIDAKLQIKIAKRQPRSDEKKQGKILNYLANSPY